MWDDPAGFPVMLIPRNLNPHQLCLIDEDRCDEAEQQIECVPLYKAVYFLLIRTLIVTVSLSVRGVVGMLYKRTPSLSGIAVSVNSRGLSTQP